MSSSFSSFLFFLCAFRSIHAVRDVTKVNASQLAKAEFGGDSMARIGLLSGDNPCVITEDIEPGEWVNRFKTEITEGQRDGEDNKVVLRIGTMGSGKSSAVDAFLKKKFGYSPEMFQILNLDRMVTSSKAYRDAVCDADGTQKHLNSNQMGDAWWAGQVATRGYETVQEISVEVSQEHMTFSIEQTGKFLCPLKAVARKLFKKGYHIIGVSPYVPYFVLKGRVANRAREEGRDVSTEELEFNVKKFLPQVFDMALETDEFHILNNDVPVGSPPEVMFSQVMDGLEDEQKCSSRQIDAQQARDLHQKIVDHASEYETNGEKEIMQIEFKFLQRLMQGAEDKKPCTWQ